MKCLKKFFEFYQRVPNNTQSLTSSKWMHFCKWRNNLTLGKNGRFAFQLWKRQEIWIENKWRCISKSSLSTDDFEPRKLKCAIIDSFSFVSFVSAFCFNYFLKISSSRSWYSDYYANPEFRCFVFLLWFTVQKH